MKRRRPPLVGLTVGRQRTAFGPWNLIADVADVRYSDGVAAAGGLPVLLSAAAGPESAADLAERVDAIVLTGGPDVEAARYGATAHPAADAPDRVRDDFEAALLEEALASRLPIFAICRGMQLLNVLCGGTLTQHLEMTSRPMRHRHAPGIFGNVDVKTVPGSRLHTLVGDAVQGRCHHHQAVHLVAAGLSVAAVSVDGVIEALESPSDGPFLLGVQWHPEAGGGRDGLFEALVAAASTR